MVPDDRIHLAEDSLDLFNCIGRAYCKTAFLEYADVRNIVSNIANFFIAQSVFLAESEEIRQLEELPSNTKRPRAHYRVYPKIDSDLCVGCGACQYRCPEKAITVQGFEVHK